MLVEVMTYLRKPIFTESHKGFSKFGGQSEGHFRADRPVHKAVPDLNDQNSIAIKITIGPDIGAFKAVRFQGSRRTFSTVFFTLLEMSIPWVMRPIPSTTSVYATGDRNEKPAALPDDRLIDHGGEEALGQCG
ncbi:hypothetical protein [Rhizobium etli]|uniref:hypothetical protein n=1 Tax=Rhizobium etli TaxID=29449 RepID=UPI0012FDA243|nr:hypothetical protein [Rhizobium etli]